MSLFSFIFALIPKIGASNLIQLTLTLKMTTAHVVETSVTDNNNGPIQDYVHPGDQTQPTFEYSGYRKRNNNAATYS